MKRKTAVIWFHIFGMTENVAMGTWMICVLIIFVDAFMGRNLGGTTLGFLIATAGYTSIGLQVVCYIGMNFFGDKNNRSPRPDVLYKYLSMDNPKSRDHTLDILENGRLYYSPPSSFNDPFECRATLLFDAPAEIKNTRAKRRLLKENPNMPDEEADALAPEHWRKMEQRGSQPLSDILHQRIGVVSFSTKADDVLMWSYYGGRHNGICLEFRATKIAHAEFFARTQQVYYQRKIPRVNFYMASMKDKVRAYVLTKAKHWSHEKEWRIVIDEPPEDRFLQIPDRVLSAVLLGALITDENRDLVLSRIAERASNGELRVYPARLKAGTYNLEFARVERVLKPPTPK